MLTIQAVAETVFGITNPSGKLPVTIYPKNYTNEVYTMLFLKIPVPSVDLCARDSRNKIMQVFDVIK